jgi:hypothetical protein
MFVAKAFFIKLINVSAITNSRFCCLYEAKIVACVFVYAEAVRAEASRALVIGIGATIVACEI